MATEEVVGGRPFYRPRPQTLVSGANFLCAAVIGDSAGAANGWSEATWQFDFASFGVSPCSLKSVFARKSVAQPDYYGNYCKGS